MSGYIFQCGMLSLYDLDWAICSAELRVRDFQTGFQTRTLNENPHTSVSISEISVSVKTHHVLISNHLTLVSHDRGLTDASTNDCGTACQKTGSAVSLAPHKSSFTPQCLVNTRCWPKKKSHYKNWQSSKLQKKKVCCMGR